ncbi:MAG: ribosome small subunit-dependent GTPase A [Bacteroidales bacterium]
MANSAVTGTVFKTTGSLHLVRTDDGQSLSCSLKGNFRILGIRTTNPVAVGDRVTIERIEQGRGVITRIHPRKNYIIRKAINLSRESHILAANLDQAILMITITYPITLSMFVDRFLVTAEAYSVPVILMFNKLDLYTEEDLAALAEWVEAYTLAGYPCYPVSLVTGKGIKAIRERLPGKITLLSGNSGVGKSTFINFLDPSKNLKTKQISDYHQLGKHTTTFPEMLELADGAFLIDTPGIRGFGVIEIGKEELYHYFPELFKYSGDCQFHNCTHTHEPGCAVRRAVEEGAIGEMRYRNYLVMMESDEDKYR